MRNFLAGKEMRVHPECYPCFLKQTLIALNTDIFDDALKHDVMKAVLEDVKGAELEKSPAHATTLIHRRIRGMLGRDPFRAIKSEYNAKALALYPGLRELVSGSPDPLETAARLAIAGNVIDFGIFTSVDMEGTIGRALARPPEVDHYQAFRQEVEEAREILYLLDNAGEAVFDKLLIETLASRGKKVTAVSKGAPVINDCTIEDALEAGISQVAEVISNGSDAVGTILEMASEGFRERFENAGLLISKGQGNFETLLGRGENIFFLFQSKCGVVSRVLGLPEGSMLLVGNRGC
jgi:uncharacterized protein with ATP-grasp and redox domains